MIVREKRWSIGTYSATAQLFNIFGPIPSIPLIWMCLESEEPSVLLAGRYWCCQWLWQVKVDIPLDEECMS